MRIAGATLIFGTAASFVLACTVSGEEATAVSATAEPVIAEAVAPAVAVPASDADALAADKPEFVEQPSPRLTTS